MEKTTAEDARFSDQIVFSVQGHSDDLLTAARAEVSRGLRRNGNKGKKNPKETVRATLTDFFYHKTRSRPVILSNIVRV